jgi:hypothetical protein
MPICSESTMKRYLAVLFPLAQCFAFSPAEQPASLPDWLANFPKSSEVTTTATAVTIDVSYNAPAETDAVVARYQAQMRTAGVMFAVTFDGIGNTISASSSDKSCVVRIRAGETGSRVRVSCAPKAEAMPSPIIPVAEVRLPPVVAPEPQAQTVRPAPENGSALAQVKADLAAIQSEIAESEKEDARYTGGLTKALTASTTAILRQTEATLEQKLVSLRAGARPLVVSAATSRTLAEVEEQIAANESKIKQQEVEAARYIGGLTRALSLATLETLRQTHAMLEQRRVGLKYAF